ncbi:unnamed protein product, partial [Mesorhabditis spiculigera]
MLSEATTDPEEAEADGTPATSPTQECSSIEDLFEGSVFSAPAADAVRRLIVIDGCNVARSSCGPSRDNVNCGGLMTVIRWFLVRNFEVVAFLPVIYNNNYNTNAVSVQVLPKLEELGVVTFTPARTARGERRAFINYDDLSVFHHHTYVQF